MENLGERYLNKIQELAKYAAPRWTQWCAALRAIDALCEEYKTSIKAVKKKSAETILDKYYPTNRTVFREAILKAMEEYANQK